MITNKDVRVENGNIVINGNKYPLDGQSPEAIMQIVEDNSDTTPTESSGAPITSGGVKTYVDDAVSQLSDEIDVALNNSKIAVITQTFSGVTIETAWGSLYESALQHVDISSLGLQSTPKAVFLGMKQSVSAVMFELIAPSDTQIPFNFVRPTQITTPIDITVTALVIY